MKISLTYRTNVIIIDIIPKNIEKCSKYRLHIEKYPYHIGNIDLIGIEYRYHIENIENIDRF